MVQSHRLRCDGERCFGVRDENWLYDDRHHLSRDRALLVARVLKPLVR